MTTRRSTLIASLLIGAGALLLLTHLGWVSGVLSWLWTLLFLAGGGGFLWLYRRDPDQWWALIPGFGLLAVGAASLMGEAGGPIFLVLIGIGFAAVYATDRRRWWALIPAGALATLAAVAWFDRARPEADGGWLFFLGLALTFGALALLPETRQRWAWFPALGLAALALIAFVSTGAGGVVLPLLLVAGGAVLLLRRGGEREGGDALASDRRDRGPSA